MVRTASPAKLIELLYQRAVELLKSAEKFVTNKEYIKANENLKKAQDIVTELNLSLDMEKGGQIAQNLRALYNYMFKKLVDANVKKDAEAIKEVRGMLEELLDTWREVMKKAGNTAETNRNVHKSGLDLNI
ncbi:MAG: flagellar export chaperone FliS [Thermotogaceae bacterium]|nr:flagellar export chaperone FliS [Thermotogaceae bacterium]